MNLSCGSINWRAFGNRMGVLIAVMAATPCFGDEPPWKVNAPIVKVEKQLYRKSPRPKAAALGWTYNVGSKLERMEWQGVERLDDVHDEQKARWSIDNGRTWSEWVNMQPSSNINYAGVTVWEGGVGRVYDPKAKRLVELWLRQINQKGRYHNFTYYRLSRDFGRTWNQPKQLRYEDGDEFDPNEPLKPSFLQKNHAFPGSSILVRRNGAIVACVGHANVDGDSKNEQRAWRMGALSFVGHWDDQAKDYRWQAGRRVQVSPDISSRGLMEAEPAELSDGRVLVVWRGSNTSKTPGRKWYAISRNGGLVFSSPAEWKYDDGSSFYSPSSFHRMIRHSVTGKLYWLGNICENPPRGNSPRYPLVIAEVDEEIPSLKKSSVTVIDDRREDQPAALQFSNFSLLEDRETHRFELQLTTYGQNPANVYTADNWKYTLTVNEQSPKAKKQSGAVHFQEHLIRDKYGYAYGIAAADLDGDGDLDLTSSDTVADRLLWFENDGKGEFTERLIQKDDPGWFERHAVGDVDGDGRPDVVVVKNQHGDVLWFRNSGSLRDGKLWQRNIVTKGGLPGAYDVSLADFDNDGDLDVAASSWTRGKRFVWFANPGKDKLDRQWTTHVIEADLIETRTVEAADVNGDGKMDLLASDTGGALLLWYENPGNPTVNAWHKHIIDDRTKGPTHGHFTDMDGDGDLDVVIACGMRPGIAPPGEHQAAWYENVGQPGRGTGWKKHKVGDVVGAFEAVAGDLDGDGDCDMVVTGWDPGQVVWFENRGDATQWKSHSLKANWVRANSVILADLDGDSQLDIAATAERGTNEFRWWQNAGRK